MDGHATSAGDSLGWAGAFYDFRVRLHGAIVQYALEESKCLLHSRRRYFREMDHTPADRLKQARVAAGFSSASEAAEALGVALATYTQHESGRRGIPRDRAPLYARRFKVPEEWLLYGKGSKASPDIPDGAERVVQVPVLGEVPAGPVREAIQQSSGFVLAPESDAPKDSYALRVSGESMNVRAPNGCTIIINPNDKALFPGRRYVIRTADGEATFKEYQEGPARLVAVSTFDNYDDIVLGNEPIEVLGRVTSVTTRL